MAEPAGDRAWAARRLDSAIDAHRAGTLDAATAGYRAVLCACPAEPDALGLLGLALYQTGAVNAAIAWLGRACRVRPDAVPARINLGTVHQDRGDLEAAERHYGIALKQAPDDVAALNNLGNTLTDLDRADEAEAVFDRALALTQTPQDPQTRQARAEVLYNRHALDLDRSHAATAERRLAEAVTLVPDHGLARVGLGLLQAARGDPAAAERTLAAIPTPALRDSAAYMRPLLDDGRTRLIGSTIGGLAFALAQARVAGLVMEFGVRFGHSLRAIAARAGQPVHGFDTFTGLPASWYGHAPGLYSTGGHLPAMPDGVTLYPGLFADTLPAMLADHPDTPVRFANIDCDLYESATDVLRTLAPRLRPGSVLAFDEYFMNPDWRNDEHRAFREAAAHFGWRYRYLGVGAFSKQAVVRLEALSSVQ